MYYIKNYPINYEVKTQINIGPNCTITPHLVTSNDLFKLKISASNKKWVQKIDDTKEDNLLKWGQRYLKDYINIDSWKIEGDYTLKERTIQYIFNNDKAASFNVEQVGLFLHQLRDKMSNVKWKLAKFNNGYLLCFFLNNDLIGYITSDVNN